MQDRINQVDETSCIARPNHQVGAKPLIRRYPRDVRITPASGRPRVIAIRLKSARSGREQMQQSMRAWTPELLDQLGREDEQPRRYFNPERLGSSEIDHQLELGGL